MVIVSERSEANNVGFVRSEVRLGKITTFSMGLRQAFVLFVLTVQNTALVLATKYTYRTGSAAYSSTTVVVCSEALKLFFSSAILVVHEGKRAAYSAIREVPSNTVSLMLPSVLYVIQNNLLFEGIKLLSPTMYMICSQSKIFTSALFSVLLLEVQLRQRQVLSLVLLACGMVAVQYEEQRGAVLSRSHPVHTSTTLLGMSIVFIAAMISGFAGAYLERMYRVKQRSVWFRNTQLACFSLPIAFATAYVRDHTLFHSGNFFNGYDKIVVVVVLLQAVGGLVVAAVLRYAGNILKCFAISISICNCAMATIMMDDSRDTNQIGVLLGVLTVIFSTFMYSAC